MERIHFNGLPFAGLTTALTAHGLGRYEASVPMQPAAEHDIVGKRSSHASQINKYRLGHILRQMWVTIDESESGRINQVHVAGDQFTKGSFRASLDIFRDQFLAVRHFQSTVRTRLSGKPNKPNSITGGIIYRVPRWSSPLLQARCYRRSGKVSRSAQ